MKSSNYDRAQYSYVVPNMDLTQIVDFTKYPLADANKEPALDPALVNVKVIYAQFSQAVLNNHDVKTNDYLAAFMGVSNFQDPQDPTKTDLAIKKMTDMRFYVYEISAPTADGKTTVFNTTINGGSTVYYSYLGQMSKDQFFVPTAAQPTEPVTPPAASSTVSSK